MIDGLPPVPERRLAVRLTPDALRQVRGGHPWVYAEAITSVSDGGGAAGTLAVIFDKDRQFAAIGLWDPYSPIRLRVLHAGKPKKIDADHWSSVIDRAARTRHVLAGRGTTGWRLLHGENDGTSGLVIDRYGTTAVCKVYSAAWLPHLNAVLEALRAAVEVERIVLRLGRLASEDKTVKAAGLRDGITVYGPESDEPVLFTENGLTFEADVVRGQKTGHFLDQRENRELIRSLASSARVLDVFSCTGGFSVHAAAGGATHVHSVDIAEPAIATAKRNMAHNASAVSSARHETTVGDAFEVMDRLVHRAQDYDIVIIDPPSFASRLAERDGAIRAYRKLTELALPLVRPGGRLFQASCSSRVTEDDLVATVQSAARGQGRPMHETQITGHALDHPIAFPQGKYLKAITAIVGEASR
ncbi:MAG: class I SAM-dependent methyltransferase [Acidimicrobiia bacterium]|nr:class I SAM-dependent methyltransferase [Acidimicrobiia bacterium]